MFCMKIFIVTDEPNTNLIEKGYDFIPFDINAYKFHLFTSKPEKTQNRLIKKVTIGTESINKGKA